MLQPEIGRQIECAQMCPGPLSNTDAVRLWLPRRHSEWIPEQITSSCWRVPCTDSHHGVLPARAEVQRLCRSHRLPSCRGTVPPSRRGNFVAADGSATIHLPEQRNHPTVNPSPRCGDAPCLRLPLHFLSSVSLLPSVVFSDRAPPLPKQRL